MKPTPKLAHAAPVHSSAADPAPSTRAAGAAVAEVGPFVLNLCSSTTPMALSQTQLPELRRFTFFVSRRREEGRERFRLHMGYFATLVEAEEWLTVVRDIYPGAWAGEAPGKKLRERAAAEAASGAPQAAAASRTALPAASPRPGTPASVSPGHPGVSGKSEQVVLAAQQALSAARAGVLPNLTVPTLQPAASAPPAAAARMIPVARPAAQSGVAVAGAAAAVARSATAPNASAAAVNARRGPMSPAAPVARAEATGAQAPNPAAPAKAAAPGAKLPAPLPRPATRHPPVTQAQPAARATAPVAKLSGQAASAAAVAQPVRSHDGGLRAGVPTMATAMRPAPTLAASQAAAAKPGARASSRPAGAGRAGDKAIPSSNVREVLAALDESTGQTRVMPAPAIPDFEPQEESSLSDTQVLRFLETRREEDGERADPEAESRSISLLKPDDTGTRRALKEAVAHNAPVSFAVQLQWSVQPVELDKVPPLAIFSAYTLYTVEGSRDGRKWYGLRLGFFGDAISAKQVAYYVRSEFASVAVVPVSSQERTRASDDDKKAAGLAFPRKARQEPVDEFKLIDSDERPAAPAAAPTQAGKQRTPARTGPLSAGPKAEQGGPAGAAAQGRRGTRVRARENRSPQTLEETLEILGASQLEIDNGSGETLNESGVRHLRVEVQKNTPFRRLIERLTERSRKD